MAARTPDASLRPQEATNTRFFRRRIALTQLYGYERHMPISGNQIRAARALVNIEQVDLARLAGVSVNTIRNMESACAKPAAGRIDTLDKVVKALRTLGVLFIAENGEGAGVRLKKIDTSDHGAI